MEGRCRRLDLRFIRGHRFFDMFKPVLDNKRAELGQPPRGKGEL